MKSLTRIMSVLAAAAVWPAIAFGQTIDSGDTAWMLTSTALVLFMTLPGLALFYAGLVRRRNVLSVLMQCLISAGLVGVLWVVLGYSLAFGEGNSFIGLSGFFLTGAAGVTVGLPFLETFATKMARAASPDDPGFVVFIPISFS